MRITNVIITYRLDTYGEDPIIMMMNIVWSLMAVVIFLWKSLLMTSLDITPPINKATPERREQYPVTTGL